MLDNATEALRQWFNREPEPDTPDDELPEVGMEVDILNEREKQQFSGTPWDGHCPICGEDYDSYTDHLQVCPGAD